MASSTTSRMNSHSPAVQYISECFIQPKYTSENSKQPMYLSPWDIALASANYNQKGLLFAKPSSLNQVDQMELFLEKLKDSLSLTLVHFYPLAARLATVKQEIPPIFSIYVNCTNSPGVRFVHALAKLTIDDIISPIYVPKTVYSFFDHVGAINHDGHTMSLLSIQVTELGDGIFIGCSANHMLMDGTSFWHFINTWSEIFKEDQPVNISRPPIHKRWFPDGHGPILNLPFTQEDQFLSRYDQEPELKERVFQFSSESLAKLKEKANLECNCTKISTFQALSAHVWRCITKSRKFPPDQETRTSVSINNRSRLNPPLSEDYFGNGVHLATATAKSGELLRNGLGWAAWKMHKLVINQTDKVIREWAEEWVKEPFTFRLGNFPNRIQIGSSPWFNVYGNDFGLGKAIAVRSGCGNKFDGKVMLFPGREGGGRMDLEICLSTSSMNFLESNKEFMETVTLSSPLN
ncbi:hypothetical protein ACH5RR_034984 [Cinchona calisaya]|uniref:Uncharacterized protein n=1 Tax=Cinchona calisaya TaxID=153742 RepID=A0ABD2YHW0_9GENT